VSRDVTTRFKVSPATVSGEWAYSFIVSDASLCPIHAAMTATGTPDRCINVAQVCRAACSLIWRTPGGFHGVAPVPRQHRWGVGFADLVRHHIGPRAAVAAQGQACGRLPRLRALSTATSRSGSGRVRRDIADFGSFSVVFPPADTRWRRAVSGFLFARLALVGVRFRAWRSGRSSRRFAPDCAQCSIVTF